MCLSNQLKIAYPFGGSSILDTDTDLEAYFSTNKNSAKCCVSPTTLS